jgi:hypothetical protein
LLELLGRQLLIGSEKVIEVENPPVAIQKKAIQPPEYASVKDSA